jgi:membrane protein DedA with SNARE-associated domain
MLEFLEQLGEHIREFIESVGYVGVALMMLLENVFPPIPSELVLPYAGFLVSDGEFNFVGVWIASQVGAVGGAVILYYVGKFGSDTLARRFLAKYGRWFGVSMADYDRSLLFFDKYGEVIILGGRLIPIVRSLISLPAGADHMPLRKFLTYTAIGTGIWNFILIFAGMQLGENWERVIGVVEQYQKVVIVLVVLAVAAFIGYRLMLYLRRDTAPEPQSE